MQNQCRSSLHFLRVDRPSADAPWLGRGLQNLPLAAAAGDTNVAPLHRRRVDRHAVTVKRQVRTTGTVHHQRTPASATPEMIAPAASNNGSSSAALIGTCSKFDLGRRQQRAHEFNACLPQNSCRARWTQVPPRHCAPRMRARRARHSDSGGIASDGRRSSPTPR